MIDCNTGTQQNTQPYTPHTMPADLPAVPLGVGSADSQPAGPPPFVVNLPECREYRIRLEGARTARAYTTIIEQLGWQTATVASVDRGTARILAEQKPPHTLLRAGDATATIVDVAEERAEKERQVAEERAAREKERAKQELERAKQRVATLTALQLPPKLRDPREQPTTRATYSKTEMVQRHGGKRRGDAVWEQAKLAWQKSRTRQLKEATTHLARLQPPTPANTNTMDLDPQPHTCGDIAALHSALTASREEVVALREWREEVRVWQTQQDAKQHKLEAEAAALRREVAELRKRDDEVRASQAQEIARGLHREAEEAAKQKYLDDWRKKVQEWLEDAEQRRKRRRKPAKRLTSGSPPSGTPANKTEDDSSSCSAVEDDADAPSPREAGVYAGSPRVGNPPPPPAVDAATKHIASLGRRTQLDSLATSAQTSPYGGKSPKGRGRGKDATRAKGVEI
eukprot:TRINITY_DN14080_c0_g1_i1.p1 TRINITY_DN14080_c0_g1~~TRINITY_DN14080_c0_g1_i1.p1  ORF type:complete len:489 (+),score=91.42 TRINITY_DN14080_c0_g1_i1:98-1468(+)